MTGARWTSVLAPLAALALASCDGGGGTPDEGLADVAFPDSGPRDDGPTDVPPVDPGPAGAHPHWAGVTWESFWPADGEVARYRVHTEDGQDLDLDARIQDGFTRWGGHWTRLVVGVPDVGQVGLALYFDRRQPWVLKLKGMELYGPENVTGPVRVEAFATPLTVVLDEPVGKHTAVDSTVFEDPEAQTGALAGRWDLSVDSYDQYVGGLLAGDLEGCAVHRTMLSGALVGGGTPLAVQTVVHADHHLVRWINGPGFVSMELLEGWKRP